MADINCLNKLLEQFEGLPRGAAEELLKDIRALQKHAAANPEFGTFNSRLNKWTKNKLTEIELAKGEVAAALRKSADFKVYRTQEALYENPVEAFKSRISGAILPASEGKNSAAARMTSLEVRHTNDFNARLEKAGLTEIVASGKLDLEIKQGVEALSKGIEMPKISEQARAAAEIFHDLYRSLLISAREAGIPVRNLMGYSGAQLDDIKKLRSAGFGKWNSEVRASGLDAQKTFGEAAGDRAKEDKILKKIYDKKVLGVYANEIEDINLTQKPAVGVNYSKKLAATRALRFTDAASEFKYQELYGRDNLLQSTMFDIKRKSRMIGAVEILGPNPELMIDKQISLATAEYKKAGREDLAEKLRVGTDSIKATLRELNHKGSVPGQDILGDTVQKLKMVQVLSKLSKAGINSIGNLAIAGMQVRSLTGKNYLQSVAMVAHEWIKLFPKEERVKMSRLAGFALEDHTRGLFGDADHWALDGMGSKMVAWQMKLNMMNYVNTMQVAVAKVVGIDLADQAAKSWGGLDVYTRAGLMAGGIQEKDFFIFKQAIQNIDDKFKAVTLEGFSQVDINSVKARAAELKMRPEKYISEMRDRYHAIMIHAGLDATTSSSPRERAGASWGKVRGTPARAVLDLLMQFKQFYFQSMNIGRKTLNMVPDQEAMSRGVLKSAGKMAGAPEAVKLALMTTALGYGVNLLNEGVTSAGDFAFEAATGSETNSHHKNLDPLHVQTWIDAMNRGGSYAPIMDMFLGDSFRFGGIAKSMAGPTFGGIGGTVIDEVGQMRDDLSKGKKSVGKVLESGAILGGKIAKQNFPFAQAPLIKQSLDFMYYNVLRESLKPGSLEQMQLRSIRDERRERE